MGSNGLSLPILRLQQHAELTCNRTAEKYALFLYLSQTLVQM